MTFASLLARKRILVTGAASGIGRGSVEAFRAFGADVFVTDLDAQALQAAWPGLAADHLAALNVTDEAQCDHCVDKALTVMGGD